MAEDFEKRQQLEQQLLEKQQAIDEVKRREETNQKEVQAAR